MATKQSLPKLLRRKAVRLLLRLLLLLLLLRLLLIEPATGLL